MRRALPHPRLAAALWIALAGLTAPPASAQNQGLVWRDGSLGSAPAGVVAPGPDDLGTADYLIRADLGEQRGGNLFHSFSRFSIGSGERATFTDQGAPNPGAIENVISRVTGGEHSQIDGTLHSTIPGADVWLLNPSGVVFGAGAVLDVKGSFHGGTGDYVNFGESDLVRFYGDPSRPSVLATAPPAAFGFLPESHAASIAVEGSKLTVPDGEALELVAGDLSLGGAEVRAPGGHMGLEAQGQVALSRSLVNVGREGDTPGTISIRGGQIKIEDGSQVLAQNESPVTPIQPLKGRERKRRTTPGPGLISVEASESVVVDDSLLSVATSAAGNAGTIQVGGLDHGGPSPDVTFRNGPGTWIFWPPEAVQVPFEIAVGASAETTAAGAGGTLRIDASSLSVVDGAVLGAGSIGAAASGDAGAVEISAASVDVARGSVIDVSSGWSRGDAGRVFLDVGTLTIDGAGGGLTGIDAVATSVGSGPLPTAPGTIEITASGRVALRNQGDIRNWCSFCTTRLADRAPDDNLVAIQAGSMVVESAGVFMGSGLGGGDAGRIEVSVDELELRDGHLYAGALEGGHSAGSISVRAGSVSVTDGGSIDASTSTTATGNAGTIDILDTGWVVLKGGVINADTFGTGNAGNITIDADSISIESGGAIDAQTYGVGNAGKVTIDTDQLVLSSGIINVRAIGTVFTGRPGGGDGGTIEITPRAKLVSITEEGFIAADSVGSGDAGTITVDADRVEFRRGGLTASSVLGGGRAGKIEVTADSILLDDQREDGGYGPRFSLLSAVLLSPDNFYTGIFSSTIGSGKSGSITLTAPEITVKNGAVVSSSTAGGGDAGDVLLKGDRIHILNGGAVTSGSVPDPRFPFAPVGNAGSVTLEAGEWIEVEGRHPVYRDRSVVSSASLGAGKSGEVRLDAPRILVDGGAVATTAVASGLGREGTAGGRVVIGAGAHPLEQLLVTNGGRIDASTFVGDQGGSIDVTATGSIVIAGSGSGIASRTGGEGTGGDLTLRAPRIEVKDGAEVSTESAPRLDEVRDIFASFYDDGLIGEPDADAATGDAGSIALTGAREVWLRRRGRIATNATSENANGGDIAIQAQKLVHLDAGEITASVGGGTGGNITVDPVFVILENVSQIVAKAGEGTGGRIVVTADNYFAFPGSGLDASAGNPALSGTVEIHSPDVNLAGTLAPLPSTFLDAASLMRERCAARRNGERSGSFAVRGPGGIPSEPDGWLRAPVVLPETPANAAATPGQSALFASLPGPFLAHGACP